MDNDFLLEKLREERPNQVINKVFGYKENEYGWYDVEVDMEQMFFDTKILHLRTILPYPLSKYTELSDKHQLSYHLSRLY